MARDVEITWADPAGALTGVEVAIQVDGAADFTVLMPVVAKGVQKKAIPSLPDGKYNFRVTSLNGAERASGVALNGVVVSTVPGNVTAVKATIT